MKPLRTYLSELALLFGYKYDDLFFEYLKSISNPNTTICGKEFKECDVGWYCKDCELDFNSIYCKDCFIKEKHIGHEVYFNPNRKGFCDCGDNLTLKPEGFCDKHKGNYDNIKDLRDFIKSSIKENLLDNINNIFNKIFLLFIDKIKDLVDKKEYHENENEIYKMFDYLETFCNKLYKNNLSFFYLFTLKFTENFPYETRHKCFSYDENKNLVTFTKGDIEKKHTCKCPFMQVMIYVLMKRNTKQNSSSFFNLFLQTYKNKIITSLSYLNCFPKLFYNKNLESFRKMGYHIMNENIGILLYQEKNIPFLENYFEEIYSECKYFVQKKDYEKLEAIFLRLYHIVEYLPNKNNLVEMNSNIDIINRIIDICCLINNSNVFENKTKFEEFQGERFEGRLLNIEVYSLLTIKCLVHIINYDKKENVKSIFEKIFEKLYEFKKYKESLSNKIFSPHLTTIKCYSLFLNRFCLYYSMKNDCDLLDSFNHFINLFPQAKEINEFLFQELISFYGFIISIFYSFFIYYGVSMKLYYSYYFNNEINLIKVDIVLMKYLLTQPEIKDKFNIRNILLFSDITSSNKYLYNLLNDNLDKTNIPVINKEEEKNLKYNNSLLEFLYLIIRDNLSIVKINFMYLNLNLKRKGEIFEKLYQNEKDKIQALIKNDIIHFILGKQNLVKRDDCYEYLKKNFHNDYAKLVDEILKNDCDKRLSTNGLVVFSLKNEILQLCDIDYIITFTSRQNAIKYMTNFQSKNFNLTNINILKPLNIEKKLMKNVYQTFYNEKNMDELIKLYNLKSINGDNGKKLDEIFIFNLTKILIFAIKLYDTDFLDENFKLKLLEKLNQIEDKQFLNHKNTDEKNIKILKEKLKKKFHENNKTAEEKHFPNTNDKFEHKDMFKKDIETCVICKQSLNKDSNNLEYFGKIYYYFSDYITDIMKKKPEDKRKKSRKFVTCNHKIHYQCFNKSIK